MSQVAIENQLGCTSPYGKEKLSAVPSAALDQALLEEDLSTPSMTSEETDAAASDEQFAGTGSEAIESRFAGLTVSEQLWTPTWATMTSRRPVMTAGADANAASPAESTGAAHSAPPQKQTPKSTLNPFAKPTVADIESTTHGLSTRIETIAKSAQRARFSASDIISSAAGQPEAPEDFVKPPSTVPSIPLQRPAEDAQARQISSRNSKVSRFSVRNDAQRVQDFSIGFQGELFVFELLKSHLPSFAEDNWTSGLRQYARAHPDYANISDYTAREKSDITYDDSEGSLTQLFLDKGLAEVASWLAAPPKYYLEVKTTTEEYYAPFYISKGQYKLAKKLTVAEGQAPKEVYVIMRVSRIQEKDPVLTIYLDPWALHQSERLDFAAENYTVTPGGKI